MKMIPVVMLLPIGGVGCFLPGQKTFPIAFMYGIDTYIYHKNQLNVGKYTIQGWYGFWNTPQENFIFFGRERVRNFETHLDVSVASARCCAHLHDLHIFT